MDSLRMVDEWHSFSELVPDDAIFQRVSGVEEYRRRTQLPAAQSAEAERVFTLVNGRIPVRKIVDVSLLGTFDAVRLLADLRRCEVIEPLDEEALERLRSVPAPSSGAFRSSMARGLIGAAPLLALALLAGFIWQRDVPPQSVPGVALHSGSHAAIEAAYTTRRTRHAVEAHRFLTGEWPSSLVDISSGGLLSAAPLGGTRRVFLLLRAARWWGAPARASALSTHR